MGGDAFGQAAAVPGFAAGGLPAAGRQMQGRAPGREQPRLLRPHDAEVSAQQLQQAGGEHGITILAALAVCHADEHALAVDVGDFQGDRCGDAQSRAVASEQHGAVLHATDLVQKTLDLVGGQDHRQFFLQTGAGESMLVPGHLQGDQIQKLYGGNESVDALRREFTLLRQVELVLANGFQIQLFRAAVEVFGEFSDIMRCSCVG